LTAPWCDGITVLSPILLIPTQSIEGDKLDFLEPYAHSFIVKVWLEETVEEARQAKWRGHITHVPDGKRRYLQDLHEITAFIAPYLQGMGVKFDMRWRVRQWLNRWKRYLMRKG
jgi:hypothetical protein